MAEDINSIQDEQTAQSQSTQKESKIASILQTLSANSAKALEFIKQDKKRLSIFIGVGVVVFLILVLIFALNHKSKKSSQQPQIEQTQEKSEQDIQKLVSIKLPEPSQDSLANSSINNLIIKGNLLYNKGHKQEAFDVFKKVANFSQSLATYNLATMQLSNNLYEDSIALYADSIQTGQNIPVSAINAAVSSYKLNRFDLYSYYLNLANDGLVESLDEPYYSYAYALTQYYSGHYFEALSPLLHPNSEEFEVQNSRLAAQIFTLFGDDANALESLKKEDNPQDYKAMGLLYARMGDYTRAKTYLSRFLQSNRTDIQSLMATQIIDLKLGNFAYAATNLENIANNRKYAEIAKETYPIKVIINPELFEVNLAQKSFWERDFENKDKLGYKTLFYFAPYKVFDIKKALEGITQGTNIKQINIQEGKNILLRSATTSKIDKVIIDGLVRIETKDLRSALKQLQTFANHNSNHSILFYNLGLIYAQLGQYEDAYTYFLKAYYLDPSDYLSGIFAILAGRFSHKDTTRLNYDLLHSFQEETFTSDTTQHFIKNFLNYINDNRIENEDWIAQATIKEPIYYALGFTYALRNKDKAQMALYIKGLKSIYPEDRVVNILELLTQSFNENLQNITLTMHSVLKSTDIDLRPIYYAGALPRELYVYSGFITGFLQEQAKIMQDHLVAEEKSPNGTLQTLGLIYIYQQEFQKAYAIYNALIDDIKENDGHTKFLAAVSAIGAGNFADAVVLLQLTKMETPSIYEARYALGLLYQNAKNFKAATSNYHFISTTPFRSEFFDFQIDTDRIYSYELQNTQHQDMEEQ